MSTACQFFPQNTIHLVVVDPGVGTERRAIILRTPIACFVAPDNGVLSYVIHQFIKGGLKGRSPFKNYSSPSPSKERGTEGVRLINDLQQIELEPELEAVAITKPQFWRSPVSPTFHGRDIFAPVTARLSLGFRPTDFGEAITIEVGNQFISGLSHTYAEGEGLLALIGSSGYLEVSLMGGSAKALLDAEVGNEVRIR